VPAVEANLRRVAHQVAFAVLTGFDAVCATTANSKIRAKRATKPCFFCPPLPHDAPIRIPRIDIMRISPIASADQSAKRITARKDRTYGCTDQVCDVKKVLANSEPSYKRTLKKLIGVLEYLLICALLLVKVFHDSQTGQAEFTFPKSFRTQNIATNGTKLHVRVGGSGPAVVLLHGYGETGDKDLARDRTVIVPDLRGMGLSAKHNGGYDKKTQGGISQASSTC
jgi:hypothetical protein